MKKHCFRSNTLRQLFLAVPASALMLGASQAQITVGINFAGGRYTSYASYNGVLYAQYFAGFPVTATAFGVAATNWTTSTGSSTGIPYDFGAAGALTAGPAGALAVDWTSVDCWGTDTGLHAGATNGAGLTVPPPGNDQVTWGILDNQGWTVNLSGLHALFTNGYVIQCIGAGPVTGSSLVNITDGISYSSSLGFSPIYTVDSVAIGLQVPTPTLTNDSITMNSVSRSVNSSNCALAGFIVTDLPVVTYCAAAAPVVAPGSSLVLSSTTIGIGNFSYQWQHAGSNIPGATFANYTNSSVASTDAGNYQVIATSSSFPSSPATGAAVVTVHLPQTNTWDTNTAASGTHPQDGSGTWSIAGTNWWTGLADTNLYVNDTAAFGVGGTGPYTVALTDSVTINEVIFNSGHYTITNTSGQTLTLQGADEITANAAGAISAPLSTGTNTFLKAGAGTLIISSGGLACGQTFVSAGTLEVLAKNGDSPYVVTNGATLEIGYSTGGGYANTGMQIYGDGTSATTGLYLAGGTTYNVSGTPTLLGAPTTIRQYGSGLAALGIFDINSTGLWCTAAASGSIIDSNILIVNDGYGMAAQVDAGANTATGDLIINGPLSISAKNGVFGFYKRGTGSLRLNGVATATNCALDIVDGSAICGTDECIGTNAILEVGAGATLYLNGTSQTVANLLTSTASPGLLGTLSMFINKGGTPSGALLTESDGNPMNFGGNLTVTNVGGALALGDTFTLFNSSGGFSGKFVSVTLPALPNGLGWTNNLPVDGTIQVVTGGGPSLVTDLSGTTNYAYVGGRATYSITAAGDPTLNYRWLQNGTTPVGSNSPTLTLTSLTAANAGYYYVIVTNDYGSAQSETNYLDVAPASGYAALVAASGPLAFWPLNEVSGTTAFDYWSGYDATYAGGYALDQATNPVTGAAGAHFDGVSGCYALTPYSAALNPAVFSVEAWVNPDAAPATTTEFCVLSCGQFASPRSGWLIYQFTGYWNFRTYYGVSTTVAANLTGITVPVVGSWTHLAATWDGTTARLYVNGALEASQVPATSPNYLPGASGGFCVAARADNTFWWSGTVSDTVLYNRVLTAQEISSHAQNRPLLSIAPAGTNVVLTWPAGRGGTLQASPTVTGSYTNVPAATTSPWTNSPSAQSLFYRLKL